MEMPRPGETFEGKYEILETLGEGGFALVYRARDIEVGRDVAVKVLRPRDFGGYDPKLESRFAREARVIASLQDPHTITMYEFGKTADGLMFMVFEYVRGADLAQRIREFGPLPPPIVEHVLRQLLSALAEAHGSGVLHRDIKPANVIVFEYMDDPWRVKLLDFGIAKPMPQEGGRDITKLTRDGTVVGTPRYMAPEQFFGEELGPRADIYSLGLLGYELLTGQPAIQGETSQDMLRSAVSRERIAVPSVPGGEALCRIIARMIEREPQARFASADEVVAALDHQVRHEPGRRPFGGDGARTQERAYDPSSGEQVTPGPYYSGSSEEYATAPRSDGSFPSHPVYTTRTRRSRSRAVMLFVLGLASIAMVGTIAVVLKKRSEPAPAPPMQQPARRDLPFITSKSEPRTPTPKPPRADEESRVDMGAASDGCGVPVDQTGFVERFAKLGFRTGSYVVYIPQNYDPHRRHSVVMLFHNALGQGRSVIDDTRYDDIARREHLILIAPSSTGDPARPWYSPDDIELVRMAYDQTRRELCVDDDHVFALGHGGGGNFVMELRCEFPLSGIAFTAAGEHTTQKVCDTPYPVPAMRMFGNTDRHVPADGGQGCWDKNTFRSAKDIAKLWLERNDVGSRPKSWLKHSGGECKLYEGKAPYVDCELNGGHDWPTAPAAVELPGCKTPPPNFPMGDTIWRFFQELGVPRHEARPEETE